MKSAPPKSWKGSSSHYKVLLTSDWYRTLVKLQSELMRATIDFYSAAGFEFALLPLTTGAVSSPMGLGSDSSPVKVCISEVETYLADSMQFYLELICRLNKVGAYYIAPSFRGEEPDERHLNQFYHSEAEVVGTLDDAITLAEKYLVHLCSHYLSLCDKEIVAMCGTSKHLGDFVRMREIPRCSFQDAVRILAADATCIRDTGLYRTITPDGESQLLKHFGGCVWLTQLDYLSVPFYQKPSGHDMRTALCADLLMGAGEVIGAGERHLSASDVNNALEHHQVSPVQYQWYIDMRDIVPLQTSGYGMGVERFLLWLCAHDDIRDMQLVPRLNGQELDI